MGITNILRWVLLLLIVPVPMGYAMCRALALRPNLAKSYLLGNFTQWAFLQLITVPIAALRTGFVPVVIAYVVFAAGMDVLGVVLWTRRPRLPLEPRPKRDFADWFALALLCLGFAALLLATALLQYENSDDWQFVSLSLDIDHTNQLFLVHNATGAPITGAFSDVRADFKRFVVSPWAVWMALLSRLTGTHAAILQHTVVPHALLLCVFACYWQFASACFKDSLFAKCSFVFLAFLIDVYTGYCWYTAENFTIRRLWQGKAAVAGLGIPALYLSLLRIDEHPEGWRRYLLLYIVCLSVCLMSSMGLILGAVLCGAAGLVYGIAKRRITVALRVWIGMFICLAYYGAFLLYW